MLIEKVSQTIEESNVSIDLEFLVEKTRKRAISRGWMQFSHKIERNKGKNNLSINEKGQNRKHHEVVQCLNKESIECLN